MTQNAHVLSLDKIRDLDEALIRFRVDAEASLGLAQSFLRAVEETLEERRRHWHRLMNKRNEELAKAKSDLRFAQALKKGNGNGCVEQELYVKRCTKLLEEAQEKVEITTRWLARIPDLIKDLEGAIRAMGGFLDSDLRQANALLGRKIANLEAYLSLANKTIEGAQ